MTKIILVNDLHELEQFISNFQYDDTAEGGIICKRCGCNFYFNVNDGLKNGVECPNCSFYSHIS